jgi:hypothetical protein
VDCWDGKNQQPVIFHGHTLTSKILFYDVVQCIKDNAFKNNPYPVILSLETHCCVAQQDVMADIFIEIFGDMLLLPTDIDKQTIREFHRPNQLKNKIILKGKRIDMEQANDEDSESDSEDVLGDTVHMPKHGVSAKLSDITYLQTMSYKGKFAEQWYKMHSYSENKLDYLYKNHCPALIQFNQTNMSRVYPKGTRFTSTNYDPSPGWFTGCQMVALNFQTNDDGMRLNHFKFRENGGCGYILKPQVLRSKTPVDFDKSEPVVRVALTIISAEHLPKPNEILKGEVIDSFVKISVIGPGVDGKVSHTTRTVYNNGFKYDLFFILTT